MFSTHGYWVQQEETMIAPIFAYYRVYTIKYKMGPHSGECGPKDKVSRFQREPSDRAPSTYLRAGTPDRNQ